MCITYCDRMLRTRNARRRTQPTRSRSRHTTVLLQLTRDRSRRPERNPFFVLRSRRVASSVHCLRCSRSCLRVRAFGPIDGCLCARTCACICLCTKLCFSKQAQRVAINSSQSNSYDSSSSSSKNNDDKKGLGERMQSTYNILL